MPLSEADLQLLIASQEEESLILDYKAAAALENTDTKKREIVKDISAMANSAGGRLIYGIREPQDSTRRHRPECLDPIDRRLISKEWLENVANNIRPRLHGLTITSVQLSSGPEAVAYVVDVPQGTTAHQALDLKYYRRFNFSSVPMYDHEIRDLMNRQTHPRITIAFAVYYRMIEVGSLMQTGRTTRERDVYLTVLAHNAGSMLARFVNGFIHVPTFLVDLGGARDNVTRIGGEEYVSVACDNTVRDVVDSKSDPIVGGRAIYGPSRFVPLLPKLSRQLATITLKPDFDRLRSSGGKIIWEAYADNAPPAEGHLLVGDLPYARE